MRSYFILSICFLSLIQYFVQSPSLQLLLAALATVAFFSSVLLARTLPRIFSVLMFAAGIAFTVYKGQTPEAAAQAVTSNVPLLTLLVFVPLLSIPFKLGGYFDAILDYLKKHADSPRKMFMGISSVLFVIGPILNIGSIRVVHELLKDLRLNPALLSKAYMVGFSSTILWSPYYAAVGVTLLYLHVSVGSYMSYGIGIALLFLATGNALFAANAKRFLQEPAEKRHEPVSPANRKRLRQLPFLIAALMLVTIAAEAVTHWSMLVLVSLASILFPIVWGIATRQWEPIRQQVVDYRDKAVPVMNNEIIMYISAGFFGQSLRGTSFGQGVSAFMVHLSDTSFLLFVLFVVVTMVIVTFAGIHQVVVVTVLATSMDPAALGTTKEMLAMILMLAWTASSVLSPVNPINLLIGTLVQRSSLQVGLRDNGLFVLVVCAIGIALLTLIH